MSTGKRLAKRSIIGTRVCAPGGDGKYYSGVIQAVKTPGNYYENSNCINLTPNTKYTVRFDSRQGSVGRTSLEFTDSQIIGPGFRSVVDTRLVAGQKVFVTFNGREVCGEVRDDADTEDVMISICPAGVDEPFEVTKKLDEVRLLESRKSARLADQDTDFARLADMAGDRKRSGSNTIDVPAPSHHHVSRKRRPSFDDEDLPPRSQMDECNAALVLMSLSGSPHSPSIYDMKNWGGASPCGSYSSASSWSWRASPSPPPAEILSPSGGMSGSPTSDEGIVRDFMVERHRRKKKKHLRRSFQCTYRGCCITLGSKDSIKIHIRHAHFKPEDHMPEGEEEFYYTDVEEEEIVIVHPIQTTPPPTLSHRDLTRPPHEDPEYQRQIVGTYRQLLSGPPIQSPSKVMKLSPRPISPKAPVSPRRGRGENKKCRKIYGMDHKDQWCTQCKWKKACTRFGD